MYAGCVIQMVMPYPDYQLSNDDLTSIQAFGLFGTLRTLTYTIDANTNSIAITDACNTYIDLESLPGFIYINGIANPDTVKMSGGLQVEVLDSSNGYIAILETGGPTLQP
jgi:hypothetical protein